MGVIEVGRGIGLAAGGVLTGLMFDVYGDYTAAYWLAAFLLLMSIVSLWALLLIKPKYSLGIQQDG